MPKTEEKQERCGATIRECETNFYAAYTGLARDRPLRRGDDFR